MAYNPNAKLRPSTIKKYEEGREMYVNGMTIEQIALKLHLERRKFSHYLQDQGIEVVNPTTKRSLDEDFFSVIDTEEKAYWLGFLYADGCICERRRGDKIKSMFLEIGLKRSDEEHLLKFAKSIRYENVKLTYRTINGSETVRIQIFCTKMCRDLIKHGCTPRKSLILKPPILDDNLITHFIRGYVDGDGYIGIKHNKTYDVLRCSILGTKEVLEYIIAHFHLKNEDYKIRLANKNGSDKCFQVEFNLKATNTILLLLYKNSNIHLTRKYNLVLPFMENVD